MKFWEKSQQDLSMLSLALEVDSKEKTGAMV